MKKITSVYIDEILLRAAKAKGINLSAVLQTVLSALLAEEERDALADERAKLEAMVRRRQGLLKILKRERDYIAMIETDIEKIEKEIMKQEEFIKHLEKSREMAALIREYNDVIRICEFDVNRSWFETREIRKQLAELGLQIDKEWHKSQVARLKLLAP